MREAIISPFHMLRVGGVAVDQLDQLCANKTLEILVNLRQCDDDIAAVCLSLESCLHNLVPRLAVDERPLRRAVLALKRDVHNHRQTHVANTSLSGIINRLAESDQTLLHDWLEKMARRARLLAVAIRCCDEETRRVSAILADTVMNSAVFDAIVVASEEFARALLKGGSPQDWAPTGRLARTAVSYVTRAALKTSPFSKMTTVAFGGQGVAHPPSGVAWVSIRRHLALALLQTCARDSGLCSFLEYEAATGIWAAGDRVLLLSPQIQVTGDLVSRQERVVFLQPTNPIIRSLISFTRGTYGDLVALLPPGAGHSAVEQLLNLGLIFPVAPWGRDDPFPVRSLARALSAIKSKRALALAEAVASVDKFAQELPLMSGESRMASLAGLRRAASDAFAAVDQTPPDWLSQHSLVYEDSAFCGEFPDLGPHIQADLSRIGRSRSTRIVQANAYEVVRDEFVEQYGHGGECCDVLGFLSTFLSDQSRNDMLHRALNRDMDLLREPTNIENTTDLGASAASPACSVFFQIAAQSHEEVLAGRYLLVVNRYNSGLGGLFARFAPLYPSISVQLRQWLQELYHHAELFDFPFLADCNNLQVGCSVGSRCIYWPTENPTTDSPAVLRLKDLRVQHSVRSNSLTLIDEHGAPVAPAYVGAIPDYLIGGPMRLLLMLLNPWLLVDTLRPAVIAGESAPKGTEFHPRIQEGRIVYERARWRMPPAEFPLRIRGEHDVAYLMRVHQWQHLYNLPDEVFLKVEEQKLVLDSRKRKPTWINFASLHTLDAARSLISDHTTAVNLVEVLPNRKSHWVTAPDGTVRVAEFITLIRWAKRKEENDAGN